MKTLGGMVVVGLVLLVSTRALGAPAPPEQNGIKLLQVCRLVVQEDDGVKVRLNTREYADLYYCLGFVWGMITLNKAYEALHRQKDGSSPLFCLPSTMTTIQGVRIIVRYLETHPERLHLYGNILAIEALLDAFPCAPAAAQ